jgi:hypothetical protein
MTVVCAGAVVTICVAVAGCARGYKAETYSPCDTVSGTSTSYGRSMALRNAERSFRLQVPDSRGELLSAGLRRVKVGPKRSSCRPYPLFGGATALVTCKVEARVCGR